MSMHMTETEQAEVEKMASKRYRFIWFARTSWNFMQGQRFGMIFGFPSAWRSFNRKCVADDLARAERQARHDKEGCAECKANVLDPPANPVWLGRVR